MRIFLSTPVIGSGQPAFAHLDKKRAFGTEWFLPKLDLTQTGLLREWVKG